MSAVDIHEIDIEYLRARLSYDVETGRLRWLTRAAADFAVAASASCWNNRYAGELADREMERQGYRKVTFAGKSRKAHRLAWALHYGRWPEGIIDHINGDRADNRISNLRDVSAAENAFNRAVHRNNKSGHVGVCFSGGKWIAKIGQQILGKFETKTQAIAVRRAAELERGSVTRAANAAYTAAYLYRRSRSSLSRMSAPAADNVPSLRGVPSDPASETIGRALQSIN